MSDPISTAIEPASAAPSATRELPLTVIEPVSGFRLLDWRELWEHRELLYFFVWRDIKVRYKQTAIGVAWAVLQPLTMMVIFTLVLGRLAPVETLDVPYPAFVFIGLVMWNFFATALSGSANSLVDSERLITKVYFPRILIPIGALGPALIDFGLNCCALALLLACYRLVPATTIIFAPLSVAVLLATLLGMGTLLASLNVAYRDIRYTFTFLLQAWMFATPAIYLPISPFAGRTSTVLETLASSGARLLEFANPVNGSIAFFRAAILGHELPWALLSSSALIAVVLLLLGLTVFRRTEDSFADII